MIIGPYIIVFVALGLQANELLFLLVVVPGTNPCHNKDSSKDGESLNPRYNLKLDHGSHRAKYYMWFFHLAWRIRLQWLDPPLRIQAGTLAWNRPGRPETACSTVSSWEVIWNSCRSEPILDRSQRGWGPCPSLLATFLTAVGPLNTLVSSQTCERKGRTS